MWALRLWFIGIKRGKNVLNLFEVLRTIPWYLKNLIRMFLWVLLFS
jgi:hypothetical protein